MAVYDGVPSIRLEGDEKRALALIPEAKALLQSVQTFKQRAQVNTFSMVQRVDEDSTIYVLSAMGQHIIQISVSPDVPELINEEFEEFEVTKFPDFYSGMVFRGHIEERETYGSDGTPNNYSVCVAFTPTPNCKDMHDELKGGRQEVTRLAVDPLPEFYMELGSPIQSIKFSQYSRLRPSMYSGTMKQVVQIVMGLGRIGKPKMRDPYKRTPDSEYINCVGEHGVQVRYDWRFARTHGIHRGADGKLWLIEISAARGVLAQLLPIFPNSDTERFLNKASARGDRAMVTALEELGCLPTGEAFPTRAVELAERIASGDVLRLLEASDLEDFYKCSPYSSGMGWAFNSKGTEAHNTGYYFGDDGFQRGVWYQVNIEIGEVHVPRRPTGPIAVGTAELRKNREGFIYCPPYKAPPQIRYVPIKFHEPLLPGLMSHEGVPDYAAAGKKPPKCDTPMFVSFVDDQLRVVSFYRNPVTDTVDETDDPRDRGECMLAGSWTITKITGERGFPAMMYSNDFDDRKALVGNVVVTDITSEDLGYDVPHLSDFIPTYQVSYVWRNRVFRRTTITDNQGGEQIVGIVAIPQYSREAYYYASGRRFDLGRRGSTVVDYDYVKDPNVGYSWRCLAGPGSQLPFPANRPDCNTTVCRGEAKCNNFANDTAHRERRIVCLAYEPGGGGGGWVVGGGGGAACHEFADSGEWLTICQDVDNISSDPRTPRPRTSVNWELGSDETASLKLITPGYGGAVSIPVTPGQVFGAWVQPSPHPRTEEIQAIAAEHSAIGSDMLIYQNGLSSYTGGKTSYGYAPDEIGLNEGYPAFIGVNQP